MMSVLTQVQHYKNRFKKPRHKIECSQKVKVIKEVNAKEMLHSFKARTRQGMQ